MTPDQHTIAEHYLEVGNGHSIYIQDWGNPQAKTPIFFLHGGPGSGNRDRYKMQFDPAKQRVIFHDQRGCGKSLPYGALEHNTTADLINDVIAIADKLAIKKFVLTGGSWGSCLALATALEHPKRVVGLVLRGIFTGSQAEIDWIDQGRFQTFFPDVWERYLETTPKNHRHNPSAYHMKQAFSEDALAAKKSIYAYANLEGSVLKLDDRYQPATFDEFDPLSMRLEMLYLKNSCFMPDRYILQHAHKLSMPMYLIQGRYDMVCPPTTAYELSKTASNCTIFWTLEGHGAEHQGWNLTRALLGQLCA